MRAVNLSIVIPAKDEEESVAILYKELIEVLRKLRKSYEIIFVDDGSIDETYREIKRIAKKDKRVKVISLRGNFGKSIALQAGFNTSKGEIIFTLDGDLQDNPKDIPKFLKELSKGYDLVSGWKRKRYDPLSKTLPSRILNFITRIITGVPIHDTNSGFKAYKKNVISSLNLYGELYRFIPIFAAKEHFRISEIEVSHRPRKFGKTKFGWERGVKGLLDLLTVVFLTGYLSRPGHFFGSLGIISFTVGVLIGLYISYLRITTGSIQYRHPLLFLGILLIIVGIQLITTGLLAELFINQNRKPDLKKYIKAH